MFEHFVRIGDGPAMGPTVISESEALRIREGSRTFSVGNHVVEEIFRDGELWFRVSNPGS